MTAFEDYLQAELPKRSALETYESVSYDADPNDGSAPAALKGAPKGTWFLQQTGSVFWRKRTSASDSWVIANIDATYEVIHIYVRDSDGDDSNPGTSSEPLETLIAARDKIPYHTNHTVIIHVGPHSGSGYAWTAINQLALNANIWIIGDGGGGVTDGFTEIVASASAQSGSDASKVVTTGGLSTTPFGGYGEYFGYTIEILTGSAAGDRRTIHHNTATDIVPNRPFTAAISSGDTYRIVEPETDIYVTTPKDALVANCGAVQYETNREANNKRVNFVNINFNSASSITLCIHNSIIGLFGVTTSKDCKITGKNSNLISGIETFNTSPSPVTDLGVGSNTEWVGWGLSSRSASSGIIIEFIDFWGSINANYVSFTNYNQAFILGGSCWGNYGLGSSVFSDVYVFGIDFPIWFGNNSVSTGVLANYNAFVELYGYGNGSIIIKGQNGIRSRNRAQTFITTGVPNGINIESSIVGIQTEQVGYVSFPVIDEMPTMNCGGKDFSVNAGSTVLPISEIVADSYFASLGNGVIERK